MTTVLVFVEVGCFDFEISEYIREYVVGGVVVLKLGVHPVDQPERQRCRQRKRRRTSSARAGRPLVYPILTLQLARLRSGGGDEGM